MYFYGFKYVYLYRIENSQKVNRNTSRENSFNFTNPRSKIALKYFPTSILLSSFVLLSRYIYFIYQNLGIKRVLSANRDRQSLFWKLSLLDLFREGGVYNQSAGSVRTEINVGLRGR